MFISSELQQKFLSTLIENQIEVSIFLKNGIKLTGKIAGSTEMAIFLNDPIPQMIYKSSVSTVACKITD